MNPLDLTGVLGDVGVRSDQPWERRRNVQYRNAVLAASLTITFVAGALAITAAHAEDTAWCPKPGTIVTVVEGGVAWSSTELGPDPEDATVCRSVKGVHAGSIADGDNVRRRLLNWVRLNGMFIYRPDTIDRM